MGVISWIVLGGLAGWIASLMVNKTGEGLLRDIILGIVGGVVGGWLFAAVGSTGLGAPSIKLRTTRTDMPLANWFRSLIVF